MFIPTFNHSLYIEARPDRLSADGGGVLLREVLEQSCIIEWLIAHLVDTRAQDQIGSSLFGVGRELLGPALRDGRSPLSCGRGACGFVGNASALSTNPQVIRFPR